MSFLVRMIVFGLTLCSALALESVRLSAQERTAVDEDGRIVDFERDIVPIFRKHCLECHNEEEAKGDFQIDDPDMVFSYVEAEDVESSTMFVDYLLSDDPDLMMPPPSKGGPLSPDELSLIRVWIEEGANWPDDVAIAPETESTIDAAEPIPAEPEVTERTLAQRIWVFQGFLHPATVHFPIALFLFGAFFVVMGLKWPDAGRHISLACLLLGAPTAIAATAMGWSFATEEGYGSWTKVDLDSEAFWHRWSGMIVTILSVVFAIIALMSLRKQSQRLEKTWKLGLLLIAVLVGLVGHQGGELSYGADFYPRAFRILFGTEHDEADSEVTSEAATEGSAPEGSAPEGSAPEGSAPEGSAPEGSAPEGSAPEGSAPEDSAPEDSAPEDSAPEDSAESAEESGETDQ